MCSHIRWSELFKVFVKKACPDLHFKYSPPSQFTRIHIEKRKWLSNSSLARKSMVYLGIFLQLRIKALTPNFQKCFPVPNLEISMKWSSEYWAPGGHCWVSLWPGGYGLDRKNPPPLFPHLLLPLLSPSPLWSCQTLNIKIEMKSTMNIQNTGRLL